MPQFKNKIDYLEKKIIDVDSLKEDKKIVKNKLMLKTQQRLNVLLNNSLY